MICSYRIMLYCFSYVSDDSFVVFCFLLFPKQKQNKIDVSHYLYHQTSNKYTSISECPNHKSLFRQTLWGTDGGGSQRSVTAEITCMSRKSYIMVYPTLQCHKIVLACLQIALMLIKHLIILSSIKNMYCRYSKIYLHRTQFSHHTILQQHKFLVKRK